MTVRAGRLRTGLRLWALLGGLLVAAPVAALDPRTDPGQYVHRWWGTAQGLPQSSVLALVQAPDRHLVVGTRGGLARFDGLSFVPFQGTAAIPLAERSVAALLVDRQRALWIGLGGLGILRLEGERFTAFSPEEGAPGALLMLYEDSGGTLWAGGWQSGLTKLDGGRWVPALPRGRLPDESIMEVATGPDGALWVGTHRGLSRVRGAEVQHVPLDGGSGWIRALVIDRKGTFWAAGEAGVYRVAEGATQRVFDGPRHGVADVEAVLEDRHGNLWFGARTGLFRWDGRQLARCSAAPTLANGPITALLEDAEGSLWVGTAGEGLFQLKDGNLLRFLDDAGRPVRTTAILEDGAGALWVGTFGAGVYRIRDGRQERFGPEHGVPAEVFSLGLAGDGAVWVGGRTGTIARWHEGRFSVQTITGRRSPSDVKAMIADPDGGMWVGLGGDGLQKIENGETTLHLRRADGLDDDMVFALHRDRTGRLWVAHARSAVWLENGRRAGAFRHPRGAFVTSFAEDDRGDVWIGTGVGLFRHRQGRFTAYYAQDGLDSEAILGVQDDGLGTLWLCSRKGVFAIRKQELDAHDQGLLGRVTSVRYAASEGMNTLECADGQGPTTWRGRDGRLWFATRAGVLSVDPTAPANARDPPPPRLEELLVDGRSLGVPAEAELAPGPHRLSFRYTTPTFLAPEAAVFRYRLDGFDRNWVAAGRARQAEYTNLPPGRYRFLVEASMGHERWRASAAPVVVRVRPRLWQTWPFWAAVVVAASVLLLLLWRQRVRRLEARFFAVMAERNRISRELHDNLSARLMGLKLLLDGAARRLPGAPAEARQELDEARAELPQSLAETRRAIWMLRAEALERGGLPRALEECGRQMTAGTKARVEVVVDGTPRPLPGHTEEHLLRVAQEALANAVRHGQAGHITVRLTFAAREVRLSIEDDGRGFPAGEARSPEGHFGLANMRERATLLGGRLVVGERSGGGARVEVVVPVRRFRTLIRRFFDGRPGARRGTTPP